ncbi:E3 ubiquitin-protein ligase MPSR1 [Linum perenne]
MFIPFILGLSRTREAETTQESEETPNSTDRMILINPFTQGTVVIEGASGGLDSLISDLFSGAGAGGQPPASKASIEELQTVEVGDCDPSGECVICLDEWGKEGEVVKEMPCKHRFHGGCVEKWLKVHGNCPVCRFQMPVEEEEVGKKDGEEEGGRVEREIWVSFSVGGRRSSSSDSNSRSGAGDAAEAGSVNGGSGDSDSTSFESID